VQCLLVHLLGRELKEQREKGRKKTWELYLGQRSQPVQRPWGVCFAQKAAERLHMAKAEGERAMLDC
jgi:hypothetical protein